MSHSSSIDISSNEKQAITPSTILNALLAAGWSYNDHGHISFASSEDLSDWQWAPLSDWPCILQRLDTAYANGIIVSVSLLIEAEASGGNFLFFPESSSISLSPSINRKEISSVFRLTDYSWYLGKLVKPIEATGYKIDRIECADY